MGLFDFFKKKELEEIANLKTQLEQYKSIINTDTELKSIRIELVNFIADNKSEIEIIKDTLYKLIEENHKILEKKKNEIEKIICEASQSPVQQPKKAPQTEEISELDIPNIIKALRLMAEGIEEEFGVEGKELYSKLKEMLSDVGYANIADKLDTFKDEIRDDFKYVQPHVQQFAEKRIITLDNHKNTTNKLITTKNDASNKPKFADNIISSRKRTAAIKKNIREKEKEINELIRKIDSGEQTIDFDMPLEHKSDSNEKPSSGN